jgi:quercetin dioxygenase-like cupin family protein
MRLIDNLTFWADTLLHGIRRVVMFRKMLLAIAALAVGLTVVGTTVLATPSSPELVVVTARGSFAEPLKVNTKFANDAKVQLKTSGDVELITQRIEAPPGSTFGWHKHPGENVNVILQGTLTLYHDEHCSEGTDYGPGSAFPTHPDEVHLAKNNGADTIIFFATYFAPKTTPPTPVRLDAPLPAPGCPQ